MEDDILGRAMFAKPLSMGSMNSGIMQGFEEDGMDDEMFMERTPQNPEIIMNNLRGDMRSVDARYEELANMVGEEAAMETPPEVMMLLQDHFAMMNQPQGIAALPQAPQMPMGGPQMPPQPAPQGMPPAMPPMAQGPQGPAMPQMPVQMARGGIVQNFADGSDDQGVTSEPAMTPDLQKIYIEQVLAPTQDVPTLEEATASRIPVYEKLLGQDSDLTSAQMLLALSDRFANFAANRDAEGRPMGGSFVSRGLGAFSGLGKELGAIQAEKSKADRAIKVAAIDAAEKEIDKIATNNAKIIESRRKAWSELIKSNKGTDYFKNAQWDWKIINEPNLVRRFAEGKTTEREDNLIASAYQKLIEPTPHYYKDQKTGEQKVDMRPGKPPDFLVKAMQDRKKLDNLRRAVRNDPTVAQRVASAGVSTGAGVPQAGSTVKPPPEATTTQALPSSLPIAQRPLFSLIPEAVGIPPSVGSGISAAPVVGGFGQSTTQRDLLEKWTLAVREFFKPGDDNRFSQGDRAELEKIMPDVKSLFSNPENMMSRFYAVDVFLESQQKKLEKVLSEKGKNIQPAEELKKSQRILDSILKFRKQLGLPRPKSVAEASKLPPNTWFYYEGPLEDIPPDSNGERSRWQQTMGPKRVKKAK